MATTLKEYYERTYPTSRNTRIFITEDLKEANHGLEGSHDALVEAILK